MSATPLSEETILHHFSAAHLSARQENAQNLARALGMLSRPRNLTSFSQEAQISLDLLPHRLSEKEWKKLEWGLIQVTQTLQLFLHDIYTNGKVFKLPQFPYEFFLNHPGYLRECRSFPPPDQLHLRYIAIDLIKEVQGNWLITGFHFSKPSGVAYALQNRRIQSQVFPELMETTHVLPISHFPTQLLENIQEESSHNRIALLSDANSPHLGFEHGFLARKMGIILAQAHDLMVRDTVLHYKTISGLQPIHSLLHLAEETHFDPVVTGKSTGIPGLFHSWRKNKIRLINPLGNTVAEDRMLFPWLESLVRYYLKEDPLFNVLPTFISTNEKHWSHVKQKPEDFCFYTPIPVFKKIKNPESVLKNSKFPFLAHPKISLASLPCLTPYGALTQKPFSLRCFLLIDKNNISVLPGGLTRLSKEDHVFINSPYTSKDTWVISTNTSSFPQPKKDKNPILLSHELGSRTAESLYWMGRYTERAECTARMFSVLDEVRLESVRTHNPLWKPLWEAISQSGGYDQQIFQKFLKQSSAKIAFYITYEIKNLASLLSSVSKAQQNANALQDYISPEAWTVINRLEQTLSANAKQSLTFGNSSMIPIRRGLEIAINQLAAFRGMILRTMLQDTGNGFFYTGLYVERILMTTASLLAVYQSNVGPLKEEYEIENPIFNAFLRMMGIQDVYHRKYQRRAQSLRVAEILLKERQSPASLVFSAQRLSDFFTRQIKNFEKGDQIATHLLKQITDFDPSSSENLPFLLNHISLQTRQLHDLISDTFFQHQPSGETQNFIMPFFS